MTYGLGKVSDGLVKGSGGLGKVSDGLGKVPDGLGKLSDGSFKCQMSCWESIRFHPLTSSFIPFGHNLSSSIINQPSFYSLPIPFNAHP